MVEKQPIVTAEDAARADAEATAKAAKAYPVAEEEPEKPKKASKPK